ncbi:MAG: hypothetical protein U0802_05090 [Candidatus Binatia bacterium]
MSPKTIEKLAAVRVRLELIDTGGASYFAEGTALLTDAEVAERRHPSPVLSRACGDNASPSSAQLAGPIACSPSACSCRWRGGASSSRSTPSPSS